MTIPAKTIILNILKNLATRIRHIEIIQLSILSFIFVLFTVSCALVALRWSSTTAVSIFLILGCCLIFAWWFWQLLSIFEKTFSVFSQAELAEQLAPQLNSQAVSAVQLFDALQKNSTAFSRKLIETHVEITAEKLTQLTLYHLYAQKQKNRRRTLIFGICIATTCVLVTGLILPKNVEKLWMLFSSQTMGDVQEAPLASDIRIVYHYPAYTKLSARTIEAGDGSVQGMLGTEIDLFAKADTDITKAYLQLFSNEANEQTLVLKVSGKRQIQGHFVIHNGGYYRFVFIDANGKQLTSTHKHQVRLITDAPVEIVMEQPSEDIQLKDLRPLEVVYRANDDFGISKLYLVEEFADKTTQKTALLNENAELLTKQYGQYRYSPSQNSVTIYLEAFDNDTVSGPKRSVSKAVKIAIKSAGQIHEDILGLEQKLLEGLVHLLGLELEQHTETTLLKQLQKVRQQTTELIQVVATDKRSKPEVLTMFENISTHLEQQQTLLHKRTFTETIPQLERDIIYLDDFLAVDRLATLKEMANDLLTAKHELKELLEQFKRSKSPELKAELQKRIESLRQKMFAMLQKMSSIRKTLPSEYRNIESAQMMRVDSGLDRLEELLKEGKLDEAANELEKLSAMLENMANSLNEAEDEYGGERYQEIRKKLATFGQDLDKVEQQQKGLADEASALLKEYRQKALEKAGKNTDQFMALANERIRQGLKGIEKLQKNSKYATDRSIENSKQHFLDIQSLLKQNAFFEAHQIAEENSNQLKLFHEVLEKRMPLKENNDVKAFPASKQSAQNAQSLAQLLAKLFADPKDVLSPEKRQQMQSMANKQQRVAEETENLEKQMSELSQDIPFFDEQSRKLVKDSKAAMNKAEQAMRLGDLSEGTKQKIVAKDQLSKLHEALQKSGKGKKQGLPLPMGQSYDQSGSGEGFGMDQSQVEIPKQDIHRANPRYRQELIEAAKQKAPQGYEEAVRKYYEELIK